MPVQTSLSLEV